MLKRIAPALLLAAGISFCRAETPLELDVVEHRLDNGLTLLVLEHRQSPIAACSIVYRVGSVNEEPGRTGISHLLEHMMFKGSETIGTRDHALEKPLLDRLDELHARLENAGGGGNGGAKSADELRKEISAVRKQADFLVVPNELWEIYERNGGTGINAGTGRDKTVYYCSLPANRLELWFLLESDRMRNSAFRQFYREKDVVLEERRLSIDDSPDGFFYEQLFASAFIAHPYRWPVIGWNSDIENISRAMIESYYRRYYAPNNAIVVVVGDVSPDKVLRMTERYFGGIPASPAPPPVVTVEPAQHGKRVIDLVFDASPRIALAFHKPSVSSGDNYACEIIEKLLSHGMTSRFHKNIVEGKRIAVSVSAYNPPMKYPFLFIIHAMPRAPHTTAEVEAAVWEELRALASEPVSDWEMEKARNQMEAEFLRMLESADGLASLLGSFEAIDSWEYLNGYLPGIRGVTPEDIMRVAGNYLKEDNCTLVTLQK